MKSRRPHVLIVAGPTASGKSGLALAVAERFHGVVINADSMQVYRELRVLTARPSAEDERRVPHRLYGVLSAADPCSAGRWREMALAEIEAAQRLGLLPVVCGGTGLYLKALTEGLSPIPDVPPEIRRRLRRRLADEGVDVLYRELEERDAAMAVGLPSGDAQRILRALEILEATGRSLADWQSAEPEGPPAGIRFDTILLLPPRETVYAACDRRLRAMIDEGALDEVRHLLALGLDPSLPAMKALGVAEFARHLAGQRTLDEALADAKQATRRYAKRQTTWFRHQIVASLTINEQFSERIIARTFAFIRQNGLTEVE